MNIDDLTIGQIKELQQFFPSTSPSAVDKPFAVGESYLIRTVTMIYVGKVVSCFSNRVVLENASWIPETSR